jgi:hypothetical protein
LCPVNVIAHDSRAKEAVRVDNPRLADLLDATPWPGKKPNAKMANMKQGHRSDLPSRDGKSSQIKQSRDGLISRQDAAKAMDVDKP